MYKNIYFKAGERKTTYTKPETKIAGKRVFIPMPAEGRVLTPMQKNTNDLKNNIVHELGSKIKPVYNNGINPYQIETARVLKKTRTKGILFEPKGYLDNLIIKSAQKETILFEPTEENLNNLIELVAKKGKLKK